MTLAVCVMLAGVLRLMLFPESQLAGTGTIQPASTNSHDISKESQPRPIEAAKSAVASTQTPMDPLVQAANQGKYPIHNNIMATVFWVGEDATADNSFISNKSSAWVTDWAKEFGGVDDPARRNGYNPAFTPKQNPFYFALPYGDFTETGIKSNIDRVYWYKEGNDSPSVLKNRWVKVTYGGRSVYGQWEDVGPYESDDVNYVFGSSQPKQRVGIDISPAMQDYLGFKGMAAISWQFVDSYQVPSGPWHNIITTSGPNWQ